MAMMKRIIFLLSLSGLLIISTFSSASHLEESSDIDEEEYDEDSDDDLKYLLKQEKGEQPESSSFEDEEDQEEDSEEQKPAEPQEIKSSPEIDEKDVVVLSKRNFSSFMKNNSYVMVQFFVPGCVPCAALMREYAAAATVLKGEVAFAKVNATQERKLTKKYEVMFMPAVYFFADGVHSVYTGQKTKDAILSWVKKRTGPGAFSITTLEEAERVFDTEKTFLLGFLDSLVGPESSLLCTASRRDDEINFYQTDNADVAKFFRIDPSVERPALVLVKKDEDEFSHYNGKLTKSAIAKFVKVNKTPLVISFTRETARQIFESNIKKQIFLFGTLQSTKKIAPVFKEAAKFFKGKLIFAFIDLENKDIAKEALTYFGIKGDSPQVMGFSSENEDGTKYKLDDEVTFENIKIFGEDFLAGRLKPYFKTDPVPETNDGDVKIVVGTTFDEIVLDESKDVLLEIYAPGCSRCQAMEPTYNKLASHLRGIDSLVIAKMDGTSNDHASAKIGGFPTFLFFAAGNRNSDPIAIEKDHTVVGLYKFLKKNARIPFRLQRPSTTSTPEDTVSWNTRESSSRDLKDEL